MSRSSGRSSVRSPQYRSADSASPARYSVSSPAANTSRHDNSANSSLYRSGSDRDSGSEEEGGGRSLEGSLDLTYDDIDVEQDVSPVPRARSNRRQAADVLNLSGGNSPRPVRRSPRQAGSPTAPTSPTGSTRDGSLFGSPLAGSPSLRDEIRARGRSSAQKYGVGSISPSPRRPIHRNRVVYESTTPGGGGGGVPGVCLVAVAVVVVAVAIFVLNPLKNKAPPVLKTEAPAKPRREIILANLIGEIQELRAKFPAQERRLWSVIAAASKSVLQVEEPAQPAVIMLVAPTGGDAGKRDVTGQDDVTDCLATHVTEAIKRAHNNSKALKLNLHDFSATRKTPDVLKLELDDLLSSSFGSGDKAGLLYNIQDLPSRTAMLFHSYCDNENAPFKDVTLTFTLKMADSANGAKVYSGDESVEEFFYEIWSDLDRDTLSPLLSRVANSIAVVKPESEDVIRKHCK